MADEKLNTGPGEEKLPEKRRLYAVFHFRY